MISVWSKFILRILITFSIFEVINDRTYMYLRSAIDGKLLERIPIPRPYYIL